MSMYDYYSRPPKRGSAAAIIWPLVLLVILALILVWRFWPHHDAELNPQARQRPVTPGGKLAEAENSAIALYKSAAPSVVHVTNLEVLRDRFSLNLQQIPKGIGSGFVWDKEGHIITNYHVIENAGAVRVTLADHSSYRVQRVAGDPNMDVAVLWIDAPKDRLKPIVIGDSHSLQVGQWAFAIGNPFGLDQSLAPGFVSALGREIKSAGGRPIKGVIQTTAPINPGNSGGPLLDSSGRLIGVNAAILSESGAWAGIGFAIPVDDVNRVVTQLIQHGKVIRPGLGIVLAADELARQLGVRQGVLIIDVYRGGAAAQAGLRPTYEKEGEVYLGDVILKINNEPVRNSKDLYAKLQQYQVGEEVTLMIRRTDPATGESRVLNAKVTLQEDAR
jgi:S1-C subfamily serine protease